MKPAPLQKLLDLRRHREEKALETLVMRENAHRAAKERVEAAKHAVIQHAAAAKVRERELMSSVMGNSLKQSAILRIQLNLEVMAIEQKELRKAVALAEKELVERRKELDKAREAYRALHREAEKLSELVQLQKARALRHQMTLNEAIEEDRPAAPHLSGQPI